MAELPIILLDDLLRDDYLPARLFIYATIEEPLHQATARDLSYFHQFPRSRGLRDGFDLQIFRLKCGSPSWVSAYNTIPEAAQAYLTSHIPARACVIGYEMPPWLIDCLNTSSVIWINIRLSPIRFARDLYLVLQSNSPEFHERLQAFHVSNDEINIEAGLVRASILHNAMYTSHFAEHRDDGAVFIGQTKSDASLIGHNGTLVSVNDYASAIKNLTASRTLLYKPHPYAGNWARQELRRIEHIIGRKVQVTHRNIYELMVLQPDAFIALSSGSLQEAPFFQKVAHTLFRPICPLDQPSIIHTRFHDFISPNFWASALDIRGAKPLLQVVPVINQNLMRRLHNTWWGYSEYLLNNDSFWDQAFYRGHTKWKQPLGSRFIKSLKRMFSKH